MFKGLANLGSMLKQAQQMSGKLQAINEELKTKRVTGNSGGGMVEVEANGLGDVLAVRIDAGLFQRGDREMIEDLLPAAVNQALARSKQLHGEAVKAITAGMELPGLNEALADLTDGNKQQ